MHKLLRITILLLYCLGSYAQDIDSVQTYTLGEVCFSPKRMRMEVVPYQRMDSLVIAHLSCQSVADAIRYFSGVQIKDYGGIGGIKTINIRSMGTNQMGVFYDGIQLGNAQNGQVDLGRFSLDNIEAIDLYNGQKCERLQSAKDYGAAGTIYLNTRRPSFANNRNYNLKVKLKTGSFGLINPTVVYNQRLSQKVAMQLSAEYTYAHGRYPFSYKKTAPNGTTLYDTTAIRENADIKSLRTEAAWFGKVTNGHWTAKAYNYYSERGLPGYIARNVFFHNQRQWDDNFFAQGNYKQSYLNNKLNFQAKAKYAYDYTHYLDPSSSGMHTDDSYYQHEAYVSSALNYTIYQWWDVSLATDFQYNHLDANTINFAYPTRFTEMAVAATTFRHPNVRFQASILGTFVQDTVKQGTSMTNKNECTPAAILTIKPWRNVAFNIRTFYKRIFRMPTFNDLYYQNIGSAKLKPEYVNQYNIGLSYQFLKPAAIFTNFGLQVDGYHNDVENKIVAIPSANPFRWQMKNYGKVRITGVDAALDMGLQWQRHWNLGLRLTYTYQRAADLSYNTSSPYYGGQLPYTPWHSGSAIVNVGWKSLELSYSFLYTGQRYNSSANIAANYIKPYTTHDISLSYTHHFNNWQLLSSVQVNNLANTQYEVVSGYPMPGTNFRIVLGVNY